MGELELPEESPNRNSVQCAIHDLHFNPAQSEGCVLCRREEKQRQASAKLRRILGGAALSVLFLVALQGAWKNWSSSSAALKPETNGAESGKLDGSPKMIAKINPEPYRESILQIEDVVYLPSPPTPLDLAKAAAASRELSVQIRQREDRLTAGQTSLRLLTWSSALDSDAGYGAPDLAPGRRAWEQLRDESFRKASWFKTLGGGAAQTPSPPQIDSRVVSALEDIGNDVNHLIQTARLESDAIGEVVGDNDREAGVAETRRRWAKWSRQWEPRVRRVATKMPNPPAPTDNPNLQVAYQRMSTALHNLSSVIVAANDTGVPFLHERNSRFDSAKRNLEEAESFLRKISAR